MITKNSKLTIRKKALKSGSSDFKAFVSQNWLISIILAIAAFLRFYKLDSLPPGLHPDEAANGLDIITMFDAHKFAAVYDTNGPREALFFYLQATSVWIGNAAGWAFLNFTPLSLRVAPAVLGVLTVFGIYLLGKEVFNRNVGFFASAFLAVSAWHIQFSRNGFRALMTPLLLVFLFYFLFRAYKNGKLQDYIATGICLGLGFYTYLSFRMVPLIFIALLIYIAITNKAYFRKNIKNIGILSAAFFIVMIPMFIHFINVPADILGRSSVSIFSGGENGDSPIRLLFDNTVKTAGMFNFSGDKNFRHNVAGLPMLDMFAGLLMWVGIVISALRIKKIEYFLLFAWFAALSLPELLTAEGIPHALRIVGVIPVVFLWAAIGLSWTLNKINTKYNLKNPLLVGTALILLISGTAGFYKYFILFPSYSEAREAYAENMVEIANDIKKQDANTKIILLTGEYGTKTIDFITHPRHINLKRYEIYAIKDLKLPQGHYKMYVEREWKDDAVKELKKIGFDKGLTAIPSKEDQKILYYEYTN